MNYQEFLQTKIVEVPKAGFDIEPSDLPDYLLPHQKDVTAWALRIGRALIASSFGLGKTRQQCEIAKQLHRRTGQPFLVICPLGVKHQFQEEDGPVLGQTWEYVRTDAEVEAAASPYLITNYERVRDGNITKTSIDKICGVSLDEGSVLRSLGSKTSQTFKELFSDVTHRFVATATPAPNDYKELIYYAEFLGVMDHGQALTRWFKRDSQKAGNLQIHPQHERDFWLWVCGWAIFLNKPSDLGHSDAGYDLPELRIHWHRISTDQRRAWSQTDNRGQQRLFLDAAGGIREAAAEKRETLDGRIEKMMDIMQANPDRNWLLWHHLEREREAIEKAVPGAQSVYGSQDLEEREKRILGFVRGEIEILSTKPEIAGSGCNFQRHCHSNIFLGIDYKFQDFIQAIHRTYRFQQTQPVDVHIIYAESEDQVIAVLKRKWQQHEALVERMRKIIQKYGLSHEAMKKDLVRSIGVKREVYEGKLFTAVNNDCVEETKSIEPNRFHAIVTSIPFSNHYEYVASTNDFGHNKDDNGFFSQMDFLIPELLRVLKPGRVAAIHVKDLVHYGHKTESGFMEINPFSAKTIMSFLRHGWLYEGEIFITTDVVRENNSTYRLGWSEMCKDGSKMGVGLPEKVLLFRKSPSDSSTAYADEPVRHSKERYTRARWQVDAHSHWRSNGNSLVYDYEEHVTNLEQMDRKGNLPSSFFADPPKSNSPWVWDDVNPMLCLNSEQSRRKVEAHVCPLPFDIVDRLIERFTSDPEMVEQPEEIYEPFGGLFTVPYRAIKLGRRGYGVELSSQYWADGVKYCKLAEENALAPTLFDLIEKTNSIVVES